MLLQKLAEHADTLDLPPLLYSEQPLRYILDLHSDGTPVSGKLVDTANPDDRALRNGQPRVVPHVDPGVRIKPRLFADDPRHTLGVDTGHRWDARRFEAYHDLVARCAEDTKEPVARAVGAFLDRGPLDQLADVPEFDSKTQWKYHRIGFRIHFPDGEVTWAHHPKSIQQWWAAEHAPDGAKGDCQVCGEHAVLVERMPVSIAGIPGAYRSATLISANEEAYQSYRQAYSEVAALCQQCAATSHQTLNALLADPSHHVRISDAAVVAFWTDATDDDVLFGSLLSGQTDEDDVRAFLRRVWRTTSAEVPNLDLAHFYALTLAGEMKRGGVRDWLDVPLPQAHRNLAQWFERMEVIGPPDDDRSVFHGLFALAAATERDANDLAPPLIRQLLRSAMRGDPIPLDVLARVVRRIRVTAQITRPQAALLRLGLTTQGETMTVALDHDTDDPAYLCGRLFSVLDDLHYRALRIETTIKDRFYGSASTTPAAVFGTLLRRSQPHLDKLSKGSPKDQQAAHFIEKRIAEILEPLQDFPTTLSVQEQARFALGFYHQQMERRHGVAEARAAKEAANDTQENDSE